MSDQLPVIQLKKVNKWFSHTRGSAPLHAVKDISLEVCNGGSGDFVVLLGPSGCGKSTVLNMISGLILADEGEVNVAGEQVTGPNPVSATVSQAYTCFPWLTATGNVEFGLSLIGMPATERVRMATEYLHKVGLGDRLHAYPRQLSGGMQQRVAIARTLAVKRPIVLMDEPFGALDAQTRAEMQQLLLDLWMEEKNVILFVTHDITEALLLANRILVFSSRPGQIVHEEIVPFPRPRDASLVHRDDFVHLSQQLLDLLKKTKEGEFSMGQLRL